MSWGEGAEMTARVFGGKPETGRSPHWRSSERRRGLRLGDRALGLGVLFLQFGQMRQQLVFLGQTREVVADHFIRPQRRFAARP